MDHEARVLSQSTNVAGIEPCSGPGRDGRAQGVAPRVVIELLDHSDIRLTMNTYT
jgi:hypothetical protein